MRFIAKSRSPVIVIITYRRTREEIVAPVVNFESDTTENEHDFN